MRKPNTFIVGAPKCGTTAMASYLAEHPNVFMSSPKEPHHFVHEDMPQKSNIPSMQLYLELFSEADEKHTVIAEASVWYLYSKSAIRKIADFDPNAKIIVMLRRPDEMVYSMHSQAVVTLQEDVLNFEQAWKLSTSSPKRSKYSKLCKEPSLLQYNQIAKYGDQLTNLKRYFREEQIHVVFYDDFKSDTLLAYNKVLAFLNLPQEERNHFPRINPNTQLRNKRVGVFLKKPPSILLTTIKQVKFFLGIENLSIKKKLMQLNQKKIQRDNLDEGTRREIIEEYKEDINRLSALTKRDLTHWLS